LLPCLPHQGVLWSWAAAGWAYCGAQDASQLGTFNGAGGTPLAVSGGANSAALLLPASPMLQIVLLLSADHLLAMQGVPAT
jgi:hypothetical protein